MPQAQVIDTSHLPYFPLPLSFSKTAPLLEKQSQEKKKKKKIHTYMNSEI